MPTHDYRTQHVELADANLARSILASCTIPFWLEAVDGDPRRAARPVLGRRHHRLPPAPRLRALARGPTDGLVLYPHFQKTLVPGWLDKALRHRHRASERLANVVLLSPSPEWVATLPGGKIPDRSDFKAFGDDHDARERAWRRATARERAAGRGVRGADAAGVDRGAAAALSAAVVPRFPRARSKIK